MNVRSILITAAMLAVCASAFPSQLGAIPAFARKYNVSCTTCHSIAPKLKEYGEEVAGNAFNLPDAPAPARSYVDAGDDLLMLHRFFPIAVRFDAYAQYAERDRGKWDMQMPYGVKLLSGGPISEHLGYYMYFYMNERGEVAGLEDAYIHFNNIFGSNLDIMAGQFQVCDPLFKRELRLTLEDYEVYRMSPGSSQASLTYDRGLMVTYGFDFGLDLVAQLVNGNGIPAAENRVFDFDNGKALAFRASQSIGPVRVGGFVYQGNEHFEVEYSDIMGLSRIGHEENTTLIYGPDLSIGNEHIELNAQYLLREDSDVPLIIPDAYITEKANMNGLLLELVYLPEADRSLWSFVGVYNRVENEYTKELYHTATLSAGRLLARNFRLVGEVTYDLEREKAKLSVGLVTAF